jgi:copper chaperone
MVGTSHPGCADQDYLMSTTTSFVVTGMTCDHCVRTVTEEVSRLVNVEHVQVDLARGVVTVHSDGPVDRAAVAAAVDEAGYEVSS